MVPLSHPSPGEYGESIIPRKKVKLKDYSPNATSLDNDVKPTMLNHQTHDHRVHASPTHSASSHPGIATTTTPSHAVMHASGIMAAAPAAQNEALDDQVGKETACGITEFVCPELLGFTGIMKKRYTDFLVNEILPSGQVVHLDDTQAPKDKKKKEAHGGPLEPAHTGSTAKGHQGESPKEDANMELAPDNGTDDVVMAGAPNVISDKSKGKPEPEFAPSQAKSRPTSMSQSSQPKDSASQPSDMEQPNIKDGEAQSINLHQPGSQAVPSTPLSMQGFNTPLQKSENLPPHMRIPAMSSAKIPLSMRDTDDTQTTSEPARKKNTVHMRQTSHGWIEVDEQMDKELKETKAAESAGETKSPKVSSQEGNMQEAGPENKTEPPVVQSTQASWQAFANKTSADAEASMGFQLKSEDLTALLSYFDSGVVNEILALHNSVINSPHRKPKDHGEVKSAVIDRHTRSKIHQDLRRMFSSHLESVTDKDGAMIITAMPEKPAFFGRDPIDNGGDGSHPNDRNRGRNNRGRGGDRNNQRRNDRPMNSRNEWADRGGDYLHFSLYKENKDTMEAISWLFRQLHLKPSAFQFAGTKDRRGVTVQRVSVYRVLAERMAMTGRSLRHAKIGNYEYQPHPLQLGALTGNEFVITLRDCNFHYPIPVDSKTLIETARIVVDQAIKNLAANGFMNYFGLQRFGTFSTSTDEVGVKILQGNFEAAIDSVLHFNPATLEAAQDPMTSAKDKVSQDDQARAFAINSFKNTGKSHHALQDLPRKFSAEYSIIQHLGRPNSSRDFLGAMQSITRNMRLMYVHAYQSLVWNMAASERWKRFGSTVMEGDLVLINEHKDKTEDENKGEDVDADGEAVVRPSQNDRAADPEEMFTRARLLSKQEAESGVYTIFDIVLPTPGYDILYPANEIGKFFETFMGSERGGGLDPYDMRRKYKDSSLSGSYRKLIARPSSDFSYDIKAYKNEDEQFVETDLDRLEKAKEVRVNAQHSRSAPLRDDPAKAYPDADLLKPEVKQETLSASGSESGGVSLDEGLDHDYKIAVILKLQLGTSQYATMALRELMKHGGARTFKQDFSGGR